MIVKKFKIFLIAPIVILSLAIILGIIFGGLNLGVDFTGGVILNVNMGETFDSEEVRDIISQVDGVSGQVTVVTAGAGEQGTTAIVRMQSDSGSSADDALINRIISELQKIWPDAAKGEVENVGAVASASLVLNALLGVGIACILMLIYIWIRFEFFSGVSAIVALLSDVLIMVAAMCIFRVPVDSTFIAACLTIVGYSINNTVILFDRVRDNLRKYSLKTTTRAEIVEKSVKETLRRTINTTVTTLIMIVTLYVFGVQSIKIFALPIIIGLVAGLYSSIFISPSIWAKLADKFNKKKQGIKAIR